MGETCLMVTPAIEQLADKIIKAYPEECTRDNFDSTKCAEWVGAYNTANNKQPDFVPGMKSLVDFTEKKRNMDGKSFLYVPIEVVYSLSNQKQRTYNVIGDHIFNKDGEEVFTADSQQQSQRKAILSKAKEQVAQEETIKERESRSIKEEHPIMSDSLSKAIKTGEWTKETLDEFDNLINEIKNGRIYYERFPQAAARAGQEGSRANVAAWLLTRGDVATDGKQPSNISPAERYERDKRDQPEQERRLIAWAKAAGLWADNASDTVKGMEHKEDRDGGEAKIYLKKGSNDVRKLISTEYFVTPQFMADRITLHNMLSPAAPMILKGFTQDEDGNILFVVDQPFIEGTTPTLEEIQEFLSRDFNKWDKDKGNTYISKDGSIYLSDMHDENVIKTPNGNLVIIDADIRLNTPDLNHAGNYVINNSLTKVPQPPSSSAASQAVIDVNGVDTENLKSTIAGFSLSPEEISAAQNKQQAQAEQAQENKTKPQRPKSVAYESALKVRDTDASKFKRAFSPQQIKDRGAMISDYFSSEIDDALMNLMDTQTAIINDDNASEKDKNEAREILNKLRDPVEGRQFAVQHVGVENILDTIKDRIKDAMDWDTQHNNGINQQKYQNILDYFTDLFNSQASLEIEEREGIRIIDLKMNDKTNAEEENDAQDDGDDDKGHTASGSDGWSFQIRYTNPFDSLSKKVRSMLYEVERPESEKDDLGHTRHYPMGQIYASFLSYLSKHMQSPDDFVAVYKDADDWEFPQRHLLPAEIEEMTQEELNDEYPNGYPIFPVLEEMADIYPWVRQVIFRLTEDYSNPKYVTWTRYPATGGAMASQFYTNFRKAYIPYAKIQLGDGKFGVTPLNYQMEDRVQYDKMVANYNNRMILTEHSIYNSDGTINKENAKWLEKWTLLLAKEARSWAGAPSAANQDSYNQYISKVQNVLQSFGIDATQDGIATYLAMDDGFVLMGMLDDLNIISKVLQNVEDEKIANFDYILDTRDKYNRNLWAHFFDGRGLITDTSYMQSFYDSASHKTKYSYSADNYLMKTMRGVAMGNREERRKFIDEHFGKYEWFKNQKTGVWRNKWLEFWYDYDGNTQEIPYNNVDNVTDYSKEEPVIRQYTQWNTDDIWQVQDRSYGHSRHGEHTEKEGYYLAPIFSDSPMSMTVRGPKLEVNELLYGYDDSKGVHHYGALVETAFQELWRIKYVQQRARAIEDGVVKPITNFDTGRGLQFCFIPELNNYTFEDGESFIDRMMRLKTARELEQAAVKAIDDIMQWKAAEYTNENISHYSAEQPISKKQFLNMVYAGISIIQLTTVDLAFYKSDIDFQKRFKEVYAGGIQLNTNSKYGRKTENVLLLSDDIITSPSYDKIANVIDNQKGLTQKDKDAIKKKFMDINVADAQAIRSMHSFRAVLDMMGRWDNRMEEALNNFNNGTWTREDFDIMYQTIKPFVYSVIDRSDGFGGSIAVPQQNKNSEICALMMYDLITNGLDNSPVYKALSRFMEDTKDSNGDYLIDMIQYESAGKVGNQGVINISFNPEKVISVIDQGIIVGGKEYVLNPAKDDNGEDLPNDATNAEKNYNAIKEQLDEKLKKGDILQDSYNKIIKYLRPTEDEIVSMLEKAALTTLSDGSTGINTEVVHTIPFDNYYQQQPTPEHHVDADTTFGSQTRNIAVADLPEDFEMTVRGKKGSRKTYKGRDAVVDFYYELLNENLIEDYFGKNNKEGLKGVFASKDSLREAIENIVRGNPKYSRDFAEALRIDKKTGNFVLSPNSPTMFNLMQEIVTSFFKNRITKQTINGAALIQAAGIGLDEKLRLLFDKEGKLLGAECYMPLTSKRLFEPLMETKTINGEEVQVLSPKKLKAAGLDKALGYRIPTENTSSMMPLIIKDFTPQQNGSSIILPAEVTTMAGSDFDVDKMFVMLSSFGVANYYMDAAKRDYAKSDAVFSEYLDLLRRSGSVNDTDAEDLTDEEQRSKFNDWFNENKDRYLREEPYIYKIEYDFNKSPKENGRRARNNMLIQIIYNTTISKEGPASVLNPQGFDDVKRAAKITRIITDGNLRGQYKKNLANTQDSENLNQALLNAPVKQLENFIDDYSAPESPIYPQTFAHLHAKNMAGANQIGIYAIQGSMAAKYQRATIKLLPEQQFEINGRTITNVDVSDEGKRLKNNGQMIGASADNGKDPNLSDMGSTTNTAPIIGYMLRAGLTHLEAALIINQPYMKNSGFRSTKYNYWKEVTGSWNPLRVPVAGITTDLLMRNIEGEDLAVDQQVAIASLCYRILCQHEAMEYLTQISRADSPNGSIQNTYAKARIQQYKVDLFQAKMGQRNFPFFRIQEALSNDAVDPSASEENIREQLKAQRMGFLHGMYALGINSFSDLVAPYFFGATRHFDNAIVKPILYNLNEKMSDEKKEKIVNAIYTSYITFVLSGSPLFGNESNDSMKNKREYYLESFPNDYQKIIQENADIRDLLKSVLQVKQFGNRKRVVLQDVGSISKEQKQDIQRRIDSLMYMDSPVAQKLAADLFIYSYYDNGLQFTNDSFSTMFTTEFLTNFAAYTETLNLLDTPLLPEEEENFIHQFLLTYPNAAYPVNSIIGKENVDEESESITIDLNDDKLRKKMVNEVMSPNPKAKGENVYLYISYNGDVYVLDQEAYESFPSTATYHKLDKYATFPRLPLFSIQMSVSQLAQEFPVLEQDEQQKNTSADTGSDAPYDTSTSNEDSSVDNSMRAAAENMPDFEAPDFDDMMFGMEDSASDKYQKEGEGELQDPFCGV